MIPLWFLPYAIACGNTFILKPSERDPRPSERIVELIAGVDEIPAGVVNLVHGARDAVSAILDHSDIDAVSFVGQASTARMVAERSAATGKRVQALGGAKNSLVVMPDANLDTSDPRDHELVVRRGRPALPRRLGRCPRRRRGATGRGRSTRFESAASDLGVGPGDADGVEVCPLVGPEARERIVGALEARGRRRCWTGASSALTTAARAGRSSAHRSSRPPTTSRTSPARSSSARCLTIVRASDLDEALEFVNGSRYGNAGSIFTTSGEAARTYRFGVEAGMIGVNVGVAAPVAWFPFSGWKDSIDGDLHANGNDAVEFYTRKKVVTSRWS